MLILVYLDSKRIGNATEELNVGSIKLTSALTDPEHVGGAIIEETGCGVLTCERLLVGKEKALV